MIMSDGPEHIQLLEKLAEIKQGLAVNTVKTTGIENIVGEIKNELKDIRLSFITHAEFEARFNTLKDNDDDKEKRIRRLETWGAIAIGLMYALQFYFNFLR